MASMKDKTMPARDGRRSEPKVKSADQEYEEWRRVMIYEIYGRQWDELPATLRGRRVS